MARMDQSARGGQPSLPASPFFATLQKNNALERQDFRQWCFRPGMLFLAAETWWSDAPRRTPHEGLDIACFLAADGNQRQLPAESTIPAAFAGSLIKIIPDFLGKTVVLRHDLLNGEGWRLHSFYGHTRPLAAEGQRLAAGRTIAALHPTAADRATGPAAHLHLSLAWIAPDIPPRLLTWQAMGREPGIRLIDPLLLLTDPWVMVF